MVAMAAIFINMAAILIKMAAMAAILNFQSGSISNIFPYIFGYTCAKFDTFITN